MFYVETLENDDDAIGGTHDLYQLIRLTPPPLITYVLEYLPELGCVIHVRHIKSLVSRFNHRTEHRILLQDLGQEHRPGEPPFGGMNAGSQTCMCSQ